MYKYVINSNQSKYFHCFYCWILYKLEENILCHVIYRKDKLTLERLIFSCTCTLFPDAL